MSKTLQQQIDCFNRRVKVGSIVQHIDSEYLYETMGEAHISADGSRAIVVADIFNAELLTRATLDVSKLKKYLWR